MSKYCTKCGRPLQEGELCECQIQEKQQSSLRHNDLANELIGFLKGFLNNPLEKSNSYIEEENIVLAVLFILVQAVTTAIFGAFIDGKIINIIEKTVGSITSLFSTTIELDKPYVSVFFSTFFLSLLLSLILGLILLCTFRVLKANISTKKVLSLVSLRSFIVIVFNILALIFGLISVGLGIAIFFASGIAALILITIILTNKNDNKKFYYAITIATLIFVALTLLIMAKSVNLYIPSLLKSKLDFSGLLSF